MTERSRPRPDCPPPPVDPAPQPRPPVGCDCAPRSPEPGSTSPAKPPCFPPTKPPTWEKPEACPADPDCHCLTKPTADPNCLETLITAKTGELAAAEKAKTFKADLEKILGKAKDGAADYTRDKYDRLVKQWVEQDEALADLVRKLDCAVPCWRCIIECYVCPFLNRMYEAEQSLKWDPANYPKAYNQYDLLDWHTRDRDAKQWRFNRIQKVLLVWAGDKPFAGTIEKVLAENAKLIAELGKLIGSDAEKIVVDVFLRLIPLHLAIAPPVVSGAPKNWITKIDKEYTVFCGCDVSKPDDCCGPDVGEPSLRQRLIGPQPYLVDPNDYFKLVCCLVEKRYDPAQGELGEADSQVAKVDAEIKRLKAVIENGLKNFDKDAKGAIPSVVDCCDFERPTDSTSTAR